jgi:hypothetical protein
LALFCAITILLPNRAALRLGGSLIPIGIIGMGMVWFARRAAEPVPSPSATPRINWRVDGVNEGAANSPCRGDIWRFTIVGN